MQVALIHELGHLAIRAGVDAIGAIQPQEPYPWGVDDAPVATAYPVAVRLQCNLSTLMAFVHALDGAHGVVAEVQDLGVAARAAAPVALKPKKPAPDEPAPAADDPDDNAPDAEPKAPVAPEAKPTTLVVEFQGEPSLFKPDRERGDLKERLTIFRPDDDDPHRLTFVANAIIRRVLPDGKVQAELEATSDHRFIEEGKTARNAVRKGDFVATRFFLVRSVKVTSVDAEIKTDDDGFPTEVTPAHLDAEVSVAAVRFRKPELRQAEPEKKGPAKATPPGGTKRKFKTPGRRL